MTDDMLVNSYKLSANYNHDILLSFSSEYRWRDRLEASCSAQNVAVNHDQGLSEQGFPWNMEVG